MRAEAAAFRAEMKEGFERMRQTMIAGLIVMVGCMFTGFATVIAALS